MKAGRSESLINYNSTETNVGNFARFITLNVQITAISGLRILPYRLYSSDISKSEDLTGTLRVVYYVHNNITILR